MRRLVGFDLNGWDDFAARNWLELPGQETKEGETQIIHGGVGGVVVQLQDTPQGDGLIGGMQAQRAPHGLGGGWGKIGGQVRRPVSDLLEKPKDHLNEIASALAAMAGSRKATVVLAIPDLPELDEKQQDALLSALRTLRPSRAVLIWRPVLAVLGALKQMDNIAWNKIETIGVVGHSAKGFTSQKLRLRKEACLAPERKSTGQLHRSAFGLDALLDQARKALCIRCSNPARTDHVMVSGLPHKLAMGYDITPEPLRQWNASWEIIEPPQNFVPDNCEIPDSLSHTLADSDLILFETPTKGTVRKHVSGSLQVALGRNLHLLAQDAIALGALEAARRLAANLPVYYDFLPQISTIVQDSEGAKNYDLIPPNALLPAGQLYRSTRPAKLGLQPGTAEIKVHLKKENINKPRRAVVPLAVPPVSGMEVELHVQQTPAAGAARLTLVSEAFAGPMVVHWDTAEELKENWWDLIDSLAPDTPTIPNRLVLPCGAENWFERENQTGLLNLLQQEIPKRWPDWKLLADKMSARPLGQYSVSTDGDLPTDLPDSAKDLLVQAIKLAEEDVRHRIAGGGTSDNHSLRFLTWLFCKCPDWIVPHMLDALEAGVGNHVFFQKFQSRTLLLQGVGRTAWRDKDQRRALDYLFTISENKWKKDQLACAAFLLSRTDSAPRFLSRDEVDRVAAIAETNVRQAAGQAFTTRYSYGPYLLVGLLRWRLKEPWALVAGSDSTANHLLTATRLLADDLASKMAGEPHLERYQAILEEVCEELEGKGTNPDLLLDLESMTKAGALNG